MVPQARLPGREAQERAARLDVGVEPRDVRVGVVQHVVLEAPEVRTRAQQVEREGHGPIHPRARGCAAVIRVVHDGEPDACHGEADGDAEERGLPGAEVNEHQERPGGGEPSDHDGALRAHRPAAVSRARGAFEMLLRPTLQVEVEGAARRKANPLQVGRHLPQKERPVARDVGRQQR